MDSTKAYIYLVDYGTGNVIKFDSNWNYISYAGGFTSVCFIISVGSNLYIAGSYIKMTDVNLSVQATSTSANYRGICYNPTTGTLFVIEFNSYNVYQISSSLSSTIGTYTINTGSYGRPFTLNIYNNVKYIGTLSSVVLT